MGLACEECPDGAVVPVFEHQRPVVESEHYWQVLGGFRFIEVLGPVLYPNLSDGGLQ